MKSNYKMTPIKLWIVKLGMIVNVLEKKKKKKKHSGGTEKGVGGCDFTNPFMMIRLIGFVLSTE